MNRKRFYGADSDLFNITYNNFLTTLKRNFKCLCQFGHQWAEKFSLGVPLNVLKFHSDWRKAQLDTTRGECVGFASSVKLAGQLRARGVADYFAILLK